jgi:hypothetical protein
MTACQRGMRFGAGLDDHGLRKQNSGFVPQEQQYGAGPPTSRSFTKESAALSLSVADRRCCTPGRCDLSSRACSPRTPQGGLPENERAWLCWTSSSTNVGRVRDPRERQEQLRCWALELDDETLQEFV